jgi:TolB-like protein/class 3 adenylate cyclase/cytochrome c-type biogenesis protein CcmH/NrfG
MAPAGPAADPVQAALTERQAAVLVADVHGYSRLMSVDSRATVDALDAARALFRRAVEAQGGRITDMAGDAVVALFESPGDAVRSALDAQGALAGAGAAVPEERRMRFRIGVHWGPVVEKPDGTVYGDGVNVAARLQALAEAGGLTVSSAVAEAVRDHVDVHFADQGEQVLKNIPYPVHVLRWVTADRRTPPGAVPAATPPRRHVSLAVLPFANLSGDPAQEYFADGVAEDLITALSRLRWLTVIARTSSFAHKGQSRDVREVGRALAARYVVEGSVRRSGDRVRVSCQLVDATTGSQVWAERYDRRLAQTFELQDEITHTIAGTLEPELSRAEQERVRHAPADRLDAWDLFHRALWHFWKYTRESHAEARRLFQAACALDPQFAPARSYLALSYFSSFINGLDEAEESFALARDTALQALAIDQRDPVARFVLGRVYTQLGQLRAAIAELEQAVRLNPSFAQAHYGLGTALARAGRWEDAVDACATAERLSPHDPMLPAFQAVRASALALGGHLDEAEAVARAALRHPTASFWNAAALASVLGHAGRGEEARREVDRLLAMRPDFSEAMYRRLFGTAEADDAGSAPTFFFEGLYKAGLPRPAGP